jgi:hypothetical protein
MISGRYSSTEQDRRAQDRDAAEGRLRRAAGHGLESAEGPKGQSDPVRTSIPQELLRELAAIREEGRELDRREGDLRRRILDLHDAGAAVEPGDLRLRVSARERTQLTVANLTAVLGPAAARSLLLRLPIVRCQAVYIERWARRSGLARRARRFDDGLS